MNKIMNKLPLDIENIIIDFVYGDKAYWKKEFKDVMRQLDNIMLYWDNENEFCLHNDWTLTEYGYICDNCLCDISYLHINDEEF